MMEELELEEVEFLKLENLQLKMGKLQREGAALQAATEAYIQSLNAKYEVEDLRKMTLKPKVNGHG